jgi:LacI family transcriptional regulator
MATIRDVARDAGVSVATVSATITGNRYVSPELIVRVNQAIASTGYRRNTLASGLKNGKTNLVGLVVPDITNPFFTDFVDHIETLAKASGYSIILGISKNDTQRESEIVQILRSNQVEGTIICPAGSAETTKALVDDYDGAIVAVDNADADGPVDSVTIDNHGAGLIAALHLTELGHRRLGILTGPDARISGVEREKGFFDGLDEALSSDVMSMNGQFSEAGGYLACQEMLQFETWPTAIFVTNNQMLIGAMRALTEAKVDVPRDVSVISVDDFPWAASFSPTLTTIRQPITLMAKECWQLFLRRVREPDAPIKSIVLEAELIARGSTIPLATPP